MQQEPVIHRGRVLLLAFLAFGAAYAGGAADLPDNFEDEAFEHVQHLADFGSRRAGSVNEGRAIEYVFGRLRQAGLKVEVEPFEFECFESTSAEFRVGGTTYVPEVIGFNPYKDALIQAGVMVLVDGDATEEQLERLDLEEKVVVTVKTDSPLAYFRLLPKRPTLVVLLKAEDYRRLAQAGDREFDLRITGSVREYQSANVVATLPAHRPTADEIVITAHLDSYKNSPGADDNGSGVGVMIELARYFAGLREGRTTNTRFVAFGAEEAGVLGARMYLSRHRTDLRNCRLLFNIDRVGGSGAAYIEALGGVTGVPPERGLSQIPIPLADKSWEGLESAWILLAPELLPLMRASNRPPWLVDIIKASIDEVGVSVSLSGGLGGDSLVFSQAGFVAASMAIGGNTVHSPNDVPAHINLRSLETCGRLVSTVVRKVMDTEAWRAGPNHEMRKSGGGGDRVLVVGAHFDAARLPSGRIGPGAVDNAAGVQPATMTMVYNTIASLLLELDRQLGQGGP